MISRMNRDQWILVAIVAVTIAGLTAGIANIAAGSHSIAWAGPTLSVAAGLGLVIVLTRISGRNRGRQQKASPVPLIVMAAFAGAVPFFSSLSATWQLSILAFVDAFLVAFLSIVIRRLRRNPHLLTRK